MKPREVGWLGLPLLLVVLGACARQVEVLSAPDTGAATVVVGNQTDWEVMIELVPPDEPAGTLTLGQVEPQGTAAFENVPVGRAFRLRASAIGSTRMLLGPERTFQPGESWEWLVRPGADWRTP